MIEEWLGKDGAFIPEDKIPCNKKGLFDGSVLIGDKHRLIYSSKNKSFKIMTDDPNIQIQWPLEVLQIWKRSNTVIWDNTPLLCRRRNKNIKNRTDKMKNTEVLFQFPIVIYDSLELNRAMKKDEDSLVEQRTDIPYAIGKAKIQPNEIKGWYEGYTRDRTIQDVQDNGFNCTAVSTHSGDFLCSWKIGKFEEMYEKHMNALQAFLEEERTKEAEQFNNEPPIEHY